MVRIYVIEVTLAPTTFLMPISLVRCDTINKDIAKSPIQLNKIAIIEPLAIILAVVFSCLNVLSIFSSTKDPKNSALGSSFFHADSIAANELAMLAGETFTKP